MVSMGAYYEIGEVPRKALTPVLALRAAILRQGEILDLNCRVPTRR